MYTSEDVDFKVGDIVVVTGSEIPYKDMEDTAEEVVVVQVLSNRSFVVDPPFTYLHQYVPVACVTSLLRLVLCVCVAVTLELFAGPQANAPDARLTTIVMPPSLAVCCFLGWLGHTGTQMCQALHLLTCVSRSAY